MLATNIPLFNEINALPLAVDPARLDEGGGIETTLRRNGAMYHTNCHLAFNNTKLIMWRNVILAVVKWTEGMQNREEQAMMV